MLLASIKMSKVDWLIDCFQLYKQYISKQTCLLYFPPKILWCHYTTRKHAVGAHPYTNRNVKGMCMLLDNAVNDVLFSVVFEKFAWPLTHFQHQKHLKQRLLQRNEWHCSTGLTFSVPPQPSLLYIQAGVLLLLVCERLGSLLHERISLCTSRFPTSRPCASAD